MKKVPTTKQIIDKINRIDRKFSRAAKHVRQIAELLETAKTYRDVNCPYCDAHLQIRITEEGKFDVIEIGN
jgi:hypothetical protein